MRHLMIYFAGVSIGLYFGIVLGGLMIWGVLQPSSAPDVPFSIPEGSSLYLMALSLALHVIALFMIIRFQPREKILEEVDETDLEVEPEPSTA